MRILKIIIFLALTLTGGEALACALCFEDAPLEEKMRLQALDLALIQQERSDYLRWMEAMPESIRPLWYRLNAKEEWHRVFDNKKARILRTFQKALKEEFPDVPQRILALYAWYGSGCGHWSGYPIYEIPAEELLLQYPTHLLLEAARAESLTEAQTEGAARLFADRDFRTDRAAELRFMPSELKTKFLDHSLRTAISDDKKGRAERAFGPDQ